MPLPGRPRKALGQNLQRLPHRMLHLLSKSKINQRNQKAHQVRLSTAEDQLFLLWKMASERVIQAGE